MLASRYFVERWQLLMSSVKPRLFRIQLLQTIKGRDFFLDSLAVSKRGNSSVL